MEPKKLVGSRGEPINTKQYVYLDVDLYNQIAFNVKKAAFEDLALKQALKWLDTPVTGKKIHWITYKKAIKNWQCIPVTIKYKNSTNTSIIKTVAAPDANLNNLIGTKYHGTLDIMSYTIGW